MWTKAISAVAVVLAVVCVWLWTELRAEQRRSRTVVELLKQVTASDAHVWKELNETLESNDLEMSKWVALVGLEGVVLLADLNAKHYGPGMLDDPSIHDARNAVVYFKQRVKAPVPKAQEGQSSDLPRRVLIPEAAPSK